MDGIFILIIIGVIVLIFVGSIMGIIAGMGVSRLQTQVYDLKRQVLLLQQPRTEVVASEASSQSETAPTRPSVVSELVPTDDMANSPVLSPLIDKEVEAETLETVEMATPASLRSSEPKIAERQSKPETPSSPKRSFEETLGAQWSVWVGGIALFLGAVFLLRYTIESGFFSPSIRILMAVILGGLLLAAGELLRRGESKLSKTFESAMPKHTAYIPGILTAVGVFALLGSVYAAYALYGFIGPELAFILMGILSLCGLALGLLHGPNLAALGLASSLVTPLLIQTSQPNAYVLYGYLTIISLAALALALKRGWGWLTAVTLFGALGWIFFSLEATQSTGTFIAWLLFSGVMYAVSTFSVSQKTGAQKTMTGWVYSSPLACAWAALLAFAVLIAFLESDYGLIHYGVGLSFAGILMFTAWIKPTQSVHIITAGLLGGLLIILRADASQTWFEHYSVAVGFVAIFIAMCYSRLFVDATSSDENLRDIVWPFMSTILPISLFFALHQSTTVSNHIASLPFIVLFAGYLWLACRIWMKRTHDGHTSAIYSLGAGLAFILFIFIGFDAMAESLGLMLGIAVWSIIAGKMSTLESRLICVGFGGLTALQILFVIVPDSTVIGPTFILNALWIYFALPALVCAFAAWWLSRGESDLWSEGLKALVLTFTALFFIFQIRHAINDGNILADRFSFEELSLQVLVGLSFTLGGTLIGPEKSDVKLQAHAKLIPNLAMGISLFTLAIFLLELCLRKAPLLNGHILIQGNPVFNSLILAYLLPAILLAGIAILSRGRRADIYVKITAALSLVALIYYITSMIRRGFVGSNLSIFDNFPNGLELYTISASWLALGILLLVLGLKGRRKDIRLASAVVITLTVLKAFLIDMASLEGVLRATSFVVLGVVLIIIGRAYQRLLMSEARK